MRTARIEIVPSRDGRWFLRLRASNSRILAHSETYASKSNAYRGARGWYDAMLDVTDPTCLQEAVEVQS